MIAPIALEFYTFKRDKDKQISYKRFRLVVYTIIYVIAITVLLFLLKEFVLWLETITFIKLIVGKIALGSSVAYFGKVLVAIIVNFVVGLLYRFFSKFVRKGLEKKNFITPEGENGEYTWKQKLDRWAIKFFHTETWFFVGKILKYISIVLSVIYILMFIVYQVPAVFKANWISYSMISMLFSAGYVYPTITLLPLWEAYLFLEGIKRLEDECPELMFNRETETSKIPVDLNVIDAEIRKQFKDYYVCDVDLSKTLQEEVSASYHHEITKLVGQTVERDKRNPQKNKELYLSCLDKMVGSDKSILVNGSFFSEFSMYFLRYLSAIIARGDNVVFVCNNDLQIEEVYQYLKDGFAENSSLYCKGFQTDTVNFDDPIWKIVKIKGEDDVIDEATIDDNSVLVTSLSYLCSTHFESEHSNFIHLIDTIVFVDSLKTFNTYNRQLAMLNTRIKHITKRNALLSKNGNINDAFRVRYMTKQVRYICFDDTRASGLDKALRNLLGVEFDSVDSMNYNSGTIVRCYNYEGIIDENGRRICPQFFDADEEVGALMNMAVLCLAKGASNVTVFADDSIPYANIAETIAANRGRVSIKVDGSNIRLNKPFYNPDKYSVLIVMDSGNNLPATIRKYVSMVSDNPSLVIVFSRPYMMRDYYTDKIDELWGSMQLERIPVEDGTIKNVVQRILVKANAGGISEDKILKLSAGIPQFDAFVKARDVNSILREILKIGGFVQGNVFDLYQYFEYSSLQDFDENGVYSSENKVKLRKRGKMVDRISGRDMVVMSLDDHDVVIPLPRNRLSQNYIAGQNLLYNGNIYHINKIDTATGHIYARLAVGGKNDEIYQYVQAREYLVELNPAKIEYVNTTKHVVLQQNEEDVSVNDVYISVFRAPTEVITSGYFDVDPHTLGVNSNDSRYHCINEPGNDELAKQTYRRYGEVTAPLYSSEPIIKSTNLVANGKGALMMSIRINGVLGADANKTMNLAATMLNELLRSMFPSVSDSVVVCPVIRGEISDEESQKVLQKQPKLTLVGETEQSPADFELIIIEDSTTDLGVVSVLMSSGEDTLNTLFRPIFNYLTWYSASNNKSDYLYYGLDHEPCCFDFASLYKLSKLLGDNKYDLKFVDLESVVEYTVCDFCGQRYNKGDEVVTLEDGRKMCKSCAENLVGNDKKVLKAHLDRAKIFLESTYGITLGDGYEFCFESTVKIVNALKQNHNLVKRGADIPIKAYVDEKKKIHIEHSIPSVNLSEILVRELTYVWQLKHLPDLPEDLAEGHLALIAIQYLRFLNEDGLATIRTNYYESNNDVSGEGYRKLVKELLENPQYNNNPFRYLLERDGSVIEDEEIYSTATTIGDGDYGLPYTPQKPDRALDGNISYFYYSRLTATQQKVYDIILKAIQNHKDKVIVDGCTFEDVKKVSKSIEYDHPELFWYDNFSTSGDQVNLFYVSSVEETAVLQKRIDEVVAKYLEGIDDSMSAYDVAIRLHVKMISAVDYDTIALNKEDKKGGPAKDKIDYIRTICGVFLDGKAVCEGYARAMQYLLQKCGVECAEAAGVTVKEAGEPGGGHAWNIVKIDGDYYYLDTTWDDSSDTVQTVKDTNVGFNYFCVTSEELTRSRDLSYCPIEIPKFDATRANYHYHNNLVLESYDLKRIKEIAQNAAKSNGTFFTIKCKTNAVYKQAFNQLCSGGQDCYDAMKYAAKVNKKIDVGGYRYRYNERMRAITIVFKMK